MARMLEVSSPSVTEMFRKLDAKGLVKYQRSRGVRLTPRGMKIASSVWDRHLSLKRFLGILDLPEEICDGDACALEHYVSPETILRIKQFISFVERRMPHLTEEFVEDISE